MPGLLQLLFRHNIHYVSDPFKECILKEPPPLTHLALLDLPQLVTVFVLNLMQLIVYLTALAPNLMFLVIAVQIAVGLQQLIAEQDAVHGYVGPSSALGASTGSTGSPTSRFPHASRPLPLQRLRTSTHMGGQSALRTPDTGYSHSPIDEFPPTLPRVSRGMKGYSGTYSGSDMLESGSLSPVEAKADVARTSAGAVPREEKISPNQRRQSSE